MLTVRRFDPDPAPVLLSLLAGHLHQAAPFEFDAAAAGTRFVSADPAPPKLFARRGHLHGLKIFFVFGHIPQDHVQLGLTVNSTIACIHYLPFCFSK